MYVHSIRSVYMNTKSVQILLFWMPLIFQEFKFQPRVNFSWISTV